MGAGIFNQGASLSLADCILSNNVATGTMGLDGKDGADGFIIVTNGSFRLLAPEVGLAGASGMPALGGAIYSQGSLNFLPVNFCQTPRTPETAEKEGTVARVSVYHRLLRGERVQAVAMAALVELPVVRASIAKLGLLI